MAEKASTSKEAQPAQSQSPVKKTLIFHVFSSDACDYSFAAFDNHANLYILKSTPQSRIPHGKLEIRKSYKVRAFQCEGQVVTIGKSTTVSLFPMPFPEAKMSKELTSQAEKLLQQHGVTSIATVKGSGTPTGKLVTVKGKVIRQVCKVAYEVLSVLSF